MSNWTLRTALSPLGVTVLACVACSCATQTSPKSETQAGPSIPAGSTNTPFSEGSAGLAGSGSSSSELTQELPVVSGRPFASHPDFPDCIHPGVFPRCDTNWCYIPPGCFVYGSPENTPGRGAVTEEQGSVTISKHLLLGKTEITNAEWASKGMPDAIYPFSCTDPSCAAIGMDWYEAAEFANLMSSEYQPPLQECYSLQGCTKDKGLVTCESYAAVQECQGFRLPTNSEWQYAAKAGTITSFYSGDISPRQTDECYDEPLLNSIAWYCGNSEKKVHPVGLKLPNQWGLFDMLGNASERGAEPGGWSPKFPAADPFLDRHPSQTRSEMGGSYLAPPAIVRTADILSSGNRGTANVGFRLVRTIAEEEAAKWQHVNPNQPLAP